MLTQTGPDVSNYLPSNLKLGASYTAKAKVLLKKTTLPNLIRRTIVKRADQAFAHADHQFDPLNTADQKAIRY